LKHYPVAAASQITQIKDLGVILDQTLQASWIGFVSCRAIGIGLGLGGELQRLSVWSGSIDGHGGLSLF
jgi:hypothetical protein